MILARPSHPHTARKGAVVCLSATIARQSASVRRPRDCPHRDRA